ncbi:response regulator transcription factor [Neorhizobium lilium]|uniref:Response regulator transcription factor n=1 Tax=Neorhizobium lilium TaxID=2503024 RepID=A0A3S3T0N7_9HYPH|nr:response regulator transcription factor [Neorhizobium lilium]RWX79218.1 response regulator transcription factor [Neorhizobium lilium]
MRILVVDQEYLVAMEAERILQERGAYETQIAMPWELAKALKESDFDMILIDAMVVAAPECQGLIRQSGLPVVLLSFRSHDLDGVPEWPGAPVVPKPFDDEQVLQAVRAFPFDPETF